MTILYVSNTAANGIGLGNDNTGTGSKSHPFLTLDHALAAAHPGDTIVLNNGTYRPTTGDSFDVTKGVTIDSVVDGGATIVGRDGHSPLLLNIADGGTVSLGAVNVDARSAAANDVSLGSEHKTFTLDLTGTHLFNATGYAIEGQVDSRVNVIASDVTYSAAISQGMLGLSSLAAGHIDIEGGSVFIAHQATFAGNEKGLPGSASVALIDATAAGVSVKVSGVEVDASLRTSNLLASGLAILNVRNAVVEDNMITLSGGTPVLYGVDVSYDLDHPLNSSGAIIKENTICNFSAGGAIIVVGEDGSPGQSLWGYADNAVIAGNVGIGNATSEAGGLHGILVGWQSGARVSDNYMQNTNLAYVMKGDFGTTTVADNLDTDTSGKSWYQKGGTGVIWLDNASYQEEGYRPDGLYIGPDIEPTVTYNASGGRAIGNTVWYAGAEDSGSFVYVKSESSIASLEDDHYHADGSLGGMAWYWQGASYYVLAQWQASHEATATSTPGGESFAQFIASLGDGFTLASLVSPMTVSVSANGKTLAVRESLIYEGGVNEAAGATIDIARARSLTLTDNSLMSGSVSGAGALVLAGGTMALEKGARLSVASWSILGGGTEASIVENLAYAGNLNEQTGSSIDIAKGATLTLAGSSTLGAIVDGIGTLSLAGGRTTIDDGAVISVSQLSISGLDTVVAVVGSTAISSPFSADAGSTLDLAGGNLSLLGTAHLSGCAIDGADRLYTDGHTAIAGLTIVGASSLENTGAVTQSRSDVILGTSAGAALLLNTSGATYAIADDAGIFGSPAAIIDNAGLFEKTGGTGISTVSASFVDTGTVMVERGTISVSGSANRIAGSIGGAGTISVSGGSTIIENGAKLSVSRWSISGRNTVVELGENLDYSGAFSESAGGTLDLRDGNVVFGGTVTFIDGFAEGFKTVYTKGKTSIAGLTLSGTASLDNTGVVTQSGHDLTLGTQSADKTLLFNASTGSYSIADDTGIVASALSFIANAGLLEKSGGSGRSTIMAALSNTGAVKAETGTLDLRDAVSGRGNDIIAGKAILEFDSTVQSGQTVSFTGNGGELVVDDPLGFSGRIADFGASDTIDVAGSFTVKNFHENAAGTEGVLTLEHGSTTTSVVLLGQYVASGFSVHSGPTGSTLITYDPNAVAMPHLAAAH